MVDDVPPRTGNYGPEVPGTVGPPGPPGPPGPAGPPGPSFLYFGGDDGTYGVGDVLGAWFPNAHPNTDEAALGQIPAPFAGNVVSARLQVAAGTTTGNFDIVVRKNAADTALVLSMTNGTASAFTTSNPFVVAAGDRLSARMSSTPTIAALDSVWLILELQQP